ncbi:MAG: magnesium/cobalt transporter CorA [Nitrosopumilus sp.]
MGLKLFRKSSKKPGDSPGSIVYVGENKTEKIKLQLINFHEKSVFEEEIDSDRLSVIDEKSGVCWLNVTGIHDPKLITKIGSHFDIHKLVLEDVANTNRISKIEEYSDSIYVILKMFYLDSNDEIKMEHVNLILKKNLLISFQEYEDDVFEPVRNRIRDGRKKIHESNSDYLFYALIDAVTDNYFVVIRKIIEKIGTLKKSITHTTSKDSLIVMDSLQDDLLVIHNSIQPLEKIFLDLSEYESDLINESNLIYFRNINDHITQILSSLDVAKEKLSSLNDYYLSVVSHRTNEIMKTLALVATICVPITVIAGVFGMNFQYMPELSYPYSYPIVLSSMGGIGIVLFSYFKKKKWI